MTAPVWAFLVVLFIPVAAAVAWAWKNRPYRPSADQLRAGDEPPRDPADIADSFVWRAGRQ